MRRFWFVLLVVPLVAACPKKTIEPEAPPLGWVTRGSLQCYAPPDFAAETNELRRKQLRSDTWSQLHAGFSGQVEGAQQMESERIDALELVLLGYPDRIEPFSRQTFERCSEVGKGGDAEAFATWLHKSAKRLSAGDCNRPLVYEVHDNIKIESGWHQRYHMCEGDKITIEVGSGAFLYTVYDTGEFERNVYHGILGDMVNPVTPGAPCQDCRAGELLMRFEADSGGDEIFPFMPLPPDTDFDVLYAEHEDSGHKFAIEYEAPEHGYISFRINDDTYYDNLFFEDPKRGYIEYIPFDIYPIIGEGEMYLGN
jgi:hypothetical protein